jgi:hypothetical protein
MVSVHASNVVDRGVEPWLGQTTEYNIGICCFSVMDAASRRNIKDFSARNQDNVSEWGDNSTRGLLF